MSEELSQFQILSCKPGVYLSDHCMIEVDISLPRDDLVRKPITYRNIKGMDSEKFIQDTKLDDLLQLENLDELIMVFENNVNEAIDRHAPEKTKIITVRHSNPWFTKEVKDQKRVVRNREKIWRKYRHQEHWIALN